VNRLRAFLAAWEYRAFRLAGPLAGVRWIARQEAIEADLWLAEVRRVRLVRGWASDPDPEWVVYGNGRAMTVRAHTGALYAWPTTSPRMGRRIVPGRASGRRVRPFWRCLLWIGLGVAIAAALEAGAILLVVGVLR
jgi:hypothetical protein